MEYRVTSTAVPAARARQGHTATRLADGRVLVAGGASGATATDVLVDENEVFDPLAGSWSVACRLHTPRQSHAALALGDRVLVVGGRGLDRTPLAAVEIVDPRASTSTRVAPLPHALSDVALVLHPELGVLAFGGFSVDGPSPWVGRYDVAGDRWTSRAPMRVAKAPCQPVVLRDGRVLVIGWGDELYDPAAGSSWQVPARTCGWADAAAAAMLDDGSVLVCGGRDRTESAVADCDVFDPVHCRFVRAGIMPGMGRYGHTLWPAGGGALVALGGATTADDQILVVGAGAIRAAHRDAWTLVRRMTEPRWRHTATRLDGGAVLVVGGATADGMQPTRRATRSAEVLHLDRARPAGP